MACAKQGKSIVFSFGPSAPLVIIELVVEMEDGREFMVQVWLKEMFVYLDTESSGGTPSRLAFGGSMMLFLIDS